jgi:hypothetical protein
MNNVFGGLNNELFPHLLIYSSSTSEIRFTLHEIRKNAKRTQSTKSYVPEGNCYVLESTKTNPISTDLRQKNAKRTQFED